MSEREKRKSYIIDGQKVSIENSTPLCRYNEIFEEVTLYISHKGRFFILADSEINGAKITFIDPDNIHALMNKHSEGIIEENYIKIFGEPTEV